MYKDNAEKNIRKWFKDKVTVMTFGTDKTINKKLKKTLENRFVKNIKGEI